MSSSSNQSILLKVAEIIGGEEAVKIVEMLNNVEEITDEEIVAKTNIKLNSVRKILYKLYERSLVGLRETRDNDTGWFVFHWRLQPDQLEGFIPNQKKQILSKLEARIEYEKNHDFYHCGTPRCKQLPFEKAVEHLFKCPICSKPLVHFDNSDIIKFLAEKITKLRSELGE